jgi:dephospho-CoA kinase
VARLEQEAIRAADALRPAAIVLEAIKLVEAGHAGWCDEVWLVECGPETQLARLVGRGMPPDDARQRISAQSGSLTLWRSAAARVIHTDGEPAAVEATVAAAMDEVVAAVDQS